MLVLDMQLFVNGGTVKIVGCIEKNNSCSSFSGKTPTVLKI